MSKGSTVSLTLQLKGKQAQDVINRLQQSQKNNTNELVRTNKHLESVLRQQATHTQKQAQQVQQLTQLNQHNARTVAQQETQTRANLRTNQLLERVLQQQARQTTLQSQQLRSQNRDYQLQVNMLRQQAAAAERLRNQLAQANHEDRQINNRNRGGGGLGRGAGLIGGVAGGFMAAKAMASAPLDRGRNFSATIFDATASITNGFEGMSKQQAKAQNQKLMQYAKDAVRQGHGTVEGVSQAAGVLSASGIYNNVDDLKLPLIAIAKSSFAAGANEVDMARIAQQIKQFGVSVERTQVAFDRMIGSGQAGGFELPDMAQFLPKILPTAKSAGYSGEQGLNTITTHLQLARKVTGTPGEAATNIDDLYGLVNQKHFKDSIAKNIDVQAGDPTKKGKKGKQVFDLTKYLANNQLQGIDSITSVAMLMNRQLGKNKDYKSLNAQLKTAIASKNTEQEMRTRQAIELVTGGQFGNVFHNKQSLAGISAIVSGVQNGDYKEIYDKSWKKEGSTATLADIKGDNEFAQAEALQQEKILAQIKIYETVNEKLGGFEKGLVNVMQSNEGLTAAILAATGAAVTFTTALGGASLLLGRSPIGGGGGGRGAGGGIIGNPATQVAAASFMGGYAIGTVINDNVVEGTQFGHDLGGTIATIMQHMPDSMGGKEAREALESEMAYLSSQASQQNQKIDQQLLDNQQFIIEMRKVSSALGNLKLDFPQPSTSTFVNQINDHNKDTGNRHGAVFPYRIP